MYTCLQFYFSSCHSVISIIYTWTSFKLYHSVRKVLIHLVIQYHSIVYIYTCTQLYFRSCHSVISIIYTWTYCKLYHSVSKVSIHLVIQYHTTVYIYLPLTLLNIGIVWSILFTLELLLSCIKVWESVHSSFNFISVLS